ncbi:hypothetical protein BBJ29_001875 [Phytophthora kernoviae]|uniref:Uncharacterized protein n=1 Tax=Phytophthora kernoviae TaxID=325452 RepID=A0A3F2RQ29_9STRA|nr:hypothetical protein BBJ29_001875 [Phytophthora kernoviae]RLN61964.1 hypothetical protein BBP00_00005065 [Phytophthora kernoviae]
MRHVTTDVFYTTKRERGPPTSLPSSSSSLQTSNRASRDLQITGVTRKDTSWQYHIEVLDVRASSISSGASSALAGQRSEEPEPVDEDQVSSYPELPPMVRYTVMRRYTDFRHLYNYLVETHGAPLRDALPKFPDGGWISYLHVQSLAPGSTSASLPSTYESNRSFAATTSSSSSAELDVPPPPPLSAPASLPPQHSQYDSSDASAVPPVSATGGYVSLSQLKSPEIRFRKKMTPGSADVRGNLKRRRLHLHSQDADDLEAEQRKPSAKKQLAMALSGALGFKRFVVGVGSGVIGTLGRIGGERAESIDAAEYQDDSDSDADDARSGTDDDIRRRNADLLKMLSSGGSQTAPQ